MKKESFRIQRIHSIFISSKVDFNMNIQINQISNKNMQTKMSIQTNKEESEHEHTNKVKQVISNMSIQTTKVGIKRILSTV